MINPTAAWTRDDQHAFVTHLSEGGAELAKDALDNGGTLTSYAAAWKRSRDDKPLAQIRRAADLMRRRADAANTDDARRPYSADTDPVPPARWGDLVDNYLGGNMGAHCAAWTPDAAHAVADWLDLMANPQAPGYRGPALAVARAYLNEGPTP